MGTDLPIVGAKYSKGRYIGFAPAVSDAFQMWCFPGDTAAQTTRNLISGKNDLSIIGAPGIFPGYASLKGGVNYLRTAVLDQAEVTLFALIRAPGLTNGVFGYAVGNFADSSGAAIGSNLLINGTNESPRQYVPQAFAARRVGGSDVARSAALPEAPGSTWAFVAARIGAGYHRIDDLTRGLSATDTISNPRSVPNGQAYLIGSSQAGAFPIVGGAIDISAAGILSRCVSDSELRSIYGQVQAYRIPKLGAF